MDRKEETGKQDEVEKITISIRINPEEKYHALLIWLIRAVVFLIIGLPMAVAGALWSMKSSIPALTTAAVIVWIVCNW